ncbi:hypothetical protein BT93_L2108 [Corymbia citriodora subsp. variegata]|uniref:Calmodulin binding protein central domain-containing protein n=1 Tax=Corymbia citriodora subsp. variegata TaxID=360336 RepID=A0A8T0CKW1_CORYI|nr:hypothetical protein BT93_L2108 [Corymbia citriodora subsp. variegata]
MNLENAGICTVRQFRQQLDRDPEKLRKILGPAMTKGKWDKLREHAETCRLNGNPHVSLDNESDHQNGRQLTDHTTDRVHRAADKFSLKQENHEDTTGKASSSFPYQVSENTAPAQQNMAPSTSAAPVGPEAPPASAGFTAEFMGNFYIKSYTCAHGGPYLLTTLMFYFFIQDLTMELAPANEPLPPRQFTRVSNFKDLIPLRVNAITTVDKSQDFNSQATMPSHGIHSSSLMGHTLNENAPFFGASMPSFQNDGATALRRPRCTYFGNTTERPANDSVPLALYPGHDVSTTVGLTNQPHDTNSQPTMPSHVIDSSSPMVRTLNENVPSYGQPYAPVSSFRDGHDGLAPLASHQPTFANNCNSLISSGRLPARSHGINLQDAMPSRMVNQHVLPSGPTYASISNFQYGGTLPVRGGNDVMDGIETDLSDGDIQDMISDMYDPNIKLMD